MKLKRKQQNEILVVDDTPANLKLLVDILISQGYKIRPASNGKQALNAVAARKPDLILLDIMMPDIDGFEVCRELKDNKQTQDIPIIFISALDALSDRVKGFDMGGVDYISKPIQPEELIVRVRNHMQLRNMQLHQEELVAERTQELLHSNEVLLKSQRHLEQAEQIGHTGNWERDIATDACFCSDEVFRIFGLEPQAEVSGKIEDCLAHIHPEDKKNVDDARSEVISNPADRYKSEHRIIRPDGTVRFVYEEGKINCDSSGKAISLIATIKDITERKLAQQKELDNAKLIHKMMLETIQVLSATIEKRDPYVTGHQQRVADLSMAIAEKMGLKVSVVEGIKLGALIHDIGKIYIPAEILSRPGKLTDIEFELIKTHAQVGLDIIKNVKFTQPIAKMILQHHERLDGSGYPNGLKEKEIILEAKIIAVADVVEAMASHRPYRASLGINIALEEIKQGSGSKYDAEVVQYCVSLFNEGGYTFPASHELKKLM